MAIRVSRRAKYFVVLAFISLCLYGSLGTNKLHSISPAAYPIHLPPLDRFAASTFFSAADDSDEDKFPDVEVTAVGNDEEILSEVPAGDLSTILKEDAQVGADTITEKVFVDELSRAKPSELSDDSTTTLSDAGQEPKPIAGSKEELPFLSTKPITEEEKFQVGRMEKYPVDKQSMYKLPKQASSVNIPKIQTEDPSLQESSAEKEIRLERRNEVRDVFKRDWGAYRASAWTHDELRPVTNVSKDPFGGWGATLVDALDTLLIMELFDEYDEASKSVAQIDFTYTTSRAIPLFETCIRYLGGLLAAYDLSVAAGRKDPVMLAQAKQVGHVLYGAFDTPNRMPILHYDYRRQARSKDVVRASADGVMSEAGSLSVEFTRLAQLTGGDEGDKIFDAIQRITNAFEESMASMVVPGLWPLRLDFSGCKPTKKKFRGKPAPTNTPKSSSPSFLKEAIRANTEKDHDVSKDRDVSLAKAQQATESLLDVLQDQTANSKGTSPAKRQLQEELVTFEDSLIISDDPVSEEECEKQGIMPSASSFTQIYSQGGLADSTYEYFTKEYLLLGGTPEAEQYKRLYEQSIEATKKWLLFKPLVPGDLGVHQILMSGDVSATVNKTPVHQTKMQHLTCFIGGMFAMGSKVFNRPEDMNLAARLTDGCVWAYNYTASGVSPEVFHMRECKDENCKWQDYLDEVEAENRSKEAVFDSANVKQGSEASEWADPGDVDRTPILVSRSAVNEDVSLEAASLGMQNFEQSQKQKARAQPVSPVKKTASAMFHTDDRYILRPEAIESVWYMYRITGDKEWQEKGWKMWQATEKLTRTPVAHSAVSSLNDLSRLYHLDSLESFWFAETLKYYYLLFSDFETISLDEYVLNTEAHAFKRPGPSQDS